MPSILSCAALWGKLGIADVRLEIGTLGSVESRNLHRGRLINYLEQHLGELDEDAHRRLHSNPLRILDSKNPEMQQIIDGAPRLLDDLDEDSLKHFEGLQRSLRDQQIDFEINPRLVRVGLLQPHCVRVGHRQTGCTGHGMCWRTL